MKLKIFSVLLVLMFASFASALTGPITTTGPDSSNAVLWAGGSGIFSATGTFSGCTIYLETCETNSVTASDWIPVGVNPALASLRTAGTVGFIVPTGWYVRARVSGPAVVAPGIKYSIAPL